MDRKATSIDAQNFTNLTIGQFLCKEILTDIFNKNVELWAHFHCHIKKSDLQFESILTRTVNTDLQSQQSLTCIDDVFYPGQKSTNEFISSSTTRKSTTQGPTIATTTQGPTTTSTKAKCPEGGNCEGDSRNCCEGQKCLYRIRAPFYFECTNVN